MDLLSLNFEYARYMQIVAEAQGEISPEQEQALEELENALIKKADSIHHVLLMLEAQAARFRAEADRIYNMAKTCENGHARLKKNIKVYLETSGQESLQGQSVAFYLRNNPPSVQINDEKEIPSEFKTVEIVEKIDKKKIAAAIKQGSTVKGAELVTNKTVSIKMPKGELK